MTTATRIPLLELTAAELMTAPLVVLPKDMSMRRAAQVLLDEHVHGAPVVDENGHCLGVISTMDFLYWGKENRDRPNLATGPQEYFAPWQIVDPAKLPEEAVSNYMTVDTVTVPPTENICELAQAMVDAQVHRLLIVAERNKPVGIISCTDLLAAVARQRSSDD